MNYEKDTFNNEENNNGQKEGDNTKQLISHNNMTIHVGKRTKKIVTALYMVTDCIEKDEPLRKKMRDLGVDLVSGIQFFSLKSPGEKIFSIPEINNAIDEITSFLSIATSIGFISEMNHTILSKEFNALKDSLDSVKAGYENNALQSWSSLHGTPEFDVALPDLIDDEQGNKKVFDKKNEIQQPITKNFSKETNVLYNKENKKDVLYRPEYNIKKTKQLKTSKESKPAHSKSERREQIIKFIKTKEFVNVKDVSGIVSSCSEKTIQRELAFLVKEGVLEKMGEKRWSQYRLKK